MFTAPITMPAWELALTVLGAAISGAALVFLNLFTVAARAFNAAERERL